MRIKFVNAYNGNEEFGAMFFKELGKLALCDIRVAQATGGYKDIVETLKKNVNFKGTITGGNQYEEPQSNGLKERVSYVYFTMPFSKTQDTFDKDDVLVERKQVEEIRSYYLEVRSVVA